MSRKDARLAHTPKAESFLVPVCMALLLHAVVFSAAFLGWSAKAHIPDRVKPPQIVKARIIAMTPKAPVVAPQPAPPPPPPPPEDDKKKEEEKKQQEELKKREEEKKKVEEQEKREEEQRKRRALEKKKKEEEEKKRKEQERKKKEEEERKRKELERQKQLEEERKKKEEEERKRLAEEKRREEQRKRVEEYLRRQAQAQEFAAQQAESDAVAVASYQDEIRRLVARYWSRPPSARSDMEVTIQIQLVPGGEVIDALVIQSSGNAAFDRSAINAIRSAGKLPVPEEQRLFDKSFRRFKMRFRPEDLSW